MVKIDKSSGYEKFEISYVPVHYIKSSPAHIPGYNNEM
jgi:hypothetical protein